MNDNHAPGGGDAARQVLFKGGRVLDYFPADIDADPDPLVEIHPEAAAKEGIGDGEWIWIENWMGRARFKAKVT